MYCKKCGKEIFDEAIICPGCGSPTIETAGTGTCNVRGIRSVNVALILHIIILVVAVIAGGYTVKGQMEFEDKVTKSAEGVFVSQYLDPKTYEFSMFTILLKDDGTCKVDNYYGKGESYKYDYTYKLEFKADSVCLIINDKRYPVTLNGDSEIESFVSEDTDREYERLNE